MIASGLYSATHGTGTRQWQASFQLMMMRLELRAACSTEVNKLLFEFVGPATLNTTTEDQLIGHIKAISVKVVHKEVHRMSFGKMAQR